MATSSADIIDEGYASLDAEDNAVLGLGIQTDEGDDRKCDEANSCAPKTAPHAEEAPKTPRAEAEACATTSDSTCVDDIAPTAGKKRGRQESCELSESAKAKSAPFIDLNGVPPQPLILKKQPSATCDKDKDKEGSSKYTGVSYHKKKWRALIWVQGKARFIGYYDKEEDAAADYARAAFKYKPTKQTLQAYGGLDLSGVPKDLPLIRKERNATGYAGVTANMGRFQAKICIGGKQKPLGTFDTAEEAALIYARARHYMDQNELSEPMESKSHGKPKMGLPKGSKNSKPSNRSGKGFIDLTGVPPQPLILKNQLSATCYKDNTRRRPIKAGSSKYTGIYFDKKLTKWKAQIRVQGKPRSIGYYDKEEDAAADYARAAFKYKSTKPPLQPYGGLDLSGVPKDLPLIRKESNATGYAGVTPKMKHFQANICIGGKHKSLGTFDTAEEAALIYARAQYFLDQNEVSKPVKSKNEGKPKVAKRGRPYGYILSKPSHRAGTGFIDLTGVPPQPLILKNQLSAQCYEDGIRRRPIKAGSSKYTGIYYREKSRKWQALIRVQGKPRSIGYFDKEEDAAADYARAAFKYKPTKPSLDLSNVPETLPLIRSEKGSTGYAGVRLMKGRFQARISMERGKEAKTLGTFDTAEEAALIYSRAKYYLDHKGKPDGEKNVALTSEALPEEATGNGDEDDDDDDPVDSCFIDSAGDKVDGVAV